MSVTCDRHPDENHEPWECPGDCSLVELLSNSDLCDGPGSIGHEHDWCGHAKLDNLYDHIAELENHLARHHPKEVTDTTREDLEDRLYTLEAEVEELEAENEKHIAKHNELVHEVAARGRRIAELEAEVERLSKRHAKGCDGNWGTCICEYQEARIERLQRRIAELEKKNAHLRRVEEAARGVRDVEQDRGLWLDAVNNGADLELFKAHAALDDALGDGT